MSLSIIDERFAEKTEQRFTLKFSPIYFFLSCSDLAANRLPIFERNYYARTVYRWIA